MKTIRELGALVKRQHPEYSDLSDEEVGRQIKARYPEEYADFIDEPTPSPLVAEVSKLVEYYNPKRGIFTSWWQGKKSASRGALARILSDEQLAVLEQAAMYEQAVLNGKMRIVAYNSYIAQHHFELGQLKAQAHLIAEALEEGYTSENWQEVKRERETASIEKARREQEYDHQLKMLDKQSDTQLALLNTESQIRLHEFKEMESVKFNNEVEMWRERTRLALIAKAMTNHQKKILVQELLDSMYRQIEEIEQGRLSDKTKRLMIEDREAIIDSFRKYRDELQLV